MLCCKKKTPTQPRKRFKIPLLFTPFESTDNYTFIISNERYFQGSRPSGGSLDIVEVVGSSPIDPTKLSVS